MILLLKNGLVYSPRFLNKKDILVLEDKIIKINNSISPPPTDFLESTVIDVANKYVIPGFIDLHVHLIGGGGEGGYTTRVPEIQLKSIIENGITTVVGLLGTDGTTRSLQSLLAKSRALEIEGINTFLWTGCYEFPTRTITDSCRDDIILIDKIIGAGEIAISDHRSSNPLDHDIDKLASECRVGGLLSGKSGILHLHVGDDSEGIKPLFRLGEKSKILLNNLLPTHINRNMRLLYQGMKYLKTGGIVDLTTGIYKTDLDIESVDASYAYKYLIENNCPIQNITMSSDSNGSMPIFENGVLKSISAGSISTDFTEFKKMLQLYNLPMEAALAPFTENPARILKFNNLGTIDINKQADLIILNKDLSIETVICKGKILMKEGKVLVKSFFNS